jgi:hypothetical protein
MLIIRGLNKTEASNLIATLLGLKAVNNGWKVEELIHIVFIQTISTRIES